MAQNQSSLAAAQFGVQASAYVTSAVHAFGADLDWIDTCLRGAGAQRALDLGCGGGHVAYRIAPHVGEVVACDLSPEMLEAVAAAAKGRGLANVTTRQAAAESLPFEDESFDVVLSRFSAHHWSDLDLGLRQAARVLKRGGRMILVDARSPGAPLLDTHLQAIEALRDPSHVRDYSLAEWMAALTLAGLAPQRVETHSLRMDFPVWIARMRTPDAASAAIRYLQDRLPDDARQHFAVESDGSFMLDTVWIDAARG